MRHLNPAVSTPNVDRKTRAPHSDFCTKSHSGQTSEYVLTPQVSLAYKRWEIRHVKTAVVLNLCLYLVLHSPPQIQNTK